MVLGLGFRVYVEVSTCSAVLLNLLRATQRGGIHGKPPNTLEHGS